MKIFGYFATVITEQTSFATCYPYAGCLVSRTLRSKMPKLSFHQKLKSVTKKCPKKPIRVYLNAKVSSL